MERSIVDITSVRSGETATDAYEDAIELALAAEGLGYSRFWVAERHGLADSIASTTPEVLIVQLAAKNSAIRVGSGTVSLNHYSPFKVAETFGPLDALAPGRIDLGLGRATTTPGRSRRRRDTSTVRSRTITRTAISGSLARRRASPRCGYSDPVRRAPRSPAAWGSPIK